jgi:hypothetical protein
MVTWLKIWRANRGNQQAGASQKSVNGCFYILKGAGHQTAAGNQHQVPTGQEQGQAGPDRFTQETFGAVTLNGIADRTTCAYPNSWLLFGRWQLYQHNKRVREGFALVPHPLEIY